MKGYTFHRHIGHVGCTCGEPPRVSDELREWARKQGYLDDEVESQVRANSRRDPFAAPSSLEVYLQQRASK